MDPLTIITTALVAGAAAGGRDAASTAVRDAYLAVRERICRSAGGAHVELVLDANETDPGVNVTEVEEVLARHGVGEDVAVRDAAAVLLKALPGEKVRYAQARIDLRGAKGVQVGDRNTQHNSFD